MHTKAKIVAISSCAVKSDASQVMQPSPLAGTYATFGNLVSADSYGSHVYANANYSLLGVIVQTVTGMSYFDYT